MPILHEGTLADLRTLMGNPPKLRRGFTQIDYPASPAAGSPFALTIDSSYWRRISALQFTLATAATAVQRQLSVGFADGNGTLFDSVPIVAIINKSTTVVPSGDLTALPLEGAGAGQDGYGTQTSPTAGTTIASAATVQPGMYNVEWEVELQGTTAAGTDNDNFGLYLGGTLQLQSVNSYQGGSYPQEPVELEVNSAQLVTVKNIATATTGAVYSANLAVSASGPSSPRFRLPSIVLQPGWQLQINVTNQQAGDQISGIAILSERYASDYASGTDAREWETFADWIAWKLNQE